MKTFKSVAATLLASAVVTGSLAGSAFADFNGDEVRFGSWVEQQRIVNARALEKLKNNPVPVIEVVGDANGDYHEDERFLGIFSAQNDRALAAHSRSAPQLGNQRGDHNGGDVFIWRQED